MINAIVGRPRAGKSYESVIYHILPSAKEGRKVVTNIPVNLEKVAQFYGKETADNIEIVITNFSDYGMVRPFSQPDDFLKHDWKNEQGQGCLFVVDEAHLCIGTDAKKPILEYLSLHGHYGHDIIIVTQSPKKLHRDLKDMIEVCWRCVKKSVYGDDEHYIKKTYHGVSTRNSDYIHEEEREYQKQYFGFYKSHTQSASAVQEAASKDIKASLFPKKKLAIAMVVVGVLMSLYLGKRVISPASDVQKSQVAETKPTESKLIEKPSVAPQPKAKQATFKATQSNKSNDAAHPFYKVSLHIDGIAEYTLKRYLVKEVYFMASQNGQPVFGLSSKDLLLAGYSVAIYGDCLVILSYENYEDWITCDSPRQEMAAADPTSDDAGA
jgi:zona occludens toxin